MRVAAFRGACGNQDSKPAGAHCDSDDPHPAVPATLSREERDGYGHQTAEGHGSPYNPINRRTTPLVQPKPSCSGYSPPPPSRGVLLAM